MRQEGENIQDGQANAHSDNPNKKADGILPTMGLIQKDESESNQHEWVASDHAPPEKKAIPGDKEKAGRLGITLGVLALLIDAGVLYFLWCDYRTQNRAWVGCSLAFWEQSKDGKAIDATLRFTNTGQTPVLGVVNQHMYCFDRPGLDIEQYIAAERAKGKIPQPVDRGPLAPGATLVVSVSDGDVKDGSPLLADIKSGKRIMYLFGDISYKDIFGEQHRTLYRYRLDPSSLTLHTYGTHNDMN